MKTKKELLDLVDHMDTSSTYEKFYRFAYTYLFGMKRRGVQGTDEFFEVIRFCWDNMKDNAANSKKKNIQRHMGVTGKDTTSIKNWCKYILQKQDLNVLDAEELRYVFGCCAHAAKAKGMINQ